MDILPPDIVNYEKDALDLLNDLNSSNQKLFRFTMLISVFGKSMKKLMNVFQNINGIVQQTNCELVMYDYLEEQGFFSSAPLLSNTFPKERLLTTKTIAMLIPFNTQELFMDEPAIYYGLNALSNNMILADRKRLRTPNGLILGTPGSGKSFSAKREILSCFLTTNDEIIICDPEGEYYPIVEALNGQVVRLATNSTAYLNPMDIQLSHKGDKEAIQLKSAFVITLMDLIAGGKQGLGNDEKGIIDECIRHIPIKFGETHGDSKGFYSPTENAITVKEGMSESQTIKTMVHEISHAVLHNPEKAKENVNKSKGTIEMEAESIAYIVCQHFGIDTSDYSFGYIAGWSEGKETKELKESMNDIRETASEMIYRIEGNLRALEKDRQKETAKEEKKPDQTEKKTEQTEKKPSLKEKLKLNKAKVKDTKSKEEVKKNERSLT